MSKRTRDRHTHCAFSKVFFGSLREYVKKQSRLLTPFFSAWVIAAMVLSVASVPSTLLAHPTGSTLNFTATPVSSSAINLSWASTSIVDPSLKNHDLRIWFCQGLGCTPTTLIFSQINDFLPVYSGTYLHAGLTGGQTYGYKIQEKHGGDVIEQSAVNIVVPPATLTVIKHVVNINDGTKVASDFAITVTGTGVSPSLFLGAESPGTLVSLSAGSYSVSEGPVAGYSGTMSVDCSGVIAPGDDKTCTITNSDVTPGTITVHKNVVGVDGSTDVSDAHGFTVKLNGGSPSAIDEGLEALYGGLAPGVYTVSEDADADYALVSITPDSDGGTAGAQVAVTSDTNTDVYIVNKQLPATVTVQKNVVAPDGTTDVADDHGFSVTVNSETKSVSENTDAVFIVDPGIYTAVESADAAYDFVGDTGSATVGSNGSAIITITNKQHTGTLHVIKHVTNHGIGISEASDFTMSVSRNDVSIGSFPGDELGTAVTMDPGIYDVTESGPAGYAMSLDGDCTSASMPSGGDMTCTVTNSDLPIGQGAITVVKSVTNDNGGTTESDAFSLTINEAPVTAGEANFLDPDTYTVDEDPFSGYVQTGIVCTDNGSPMDGSTINLEAGHAYVCTITNDDQQGTLHVVKNLVNDNGGTAEATDFSFSIDDGDPVAFEDDGQNDITVDAGTYTVAEEAVSGYATSYENCTDVSVANGGEATCTITNDDIAPTLTLVKIVVNDNGGAATTTDWTLTAIDSDEEVALSGEGSAESDGCFKAGIYTLSESGPDGYTSSAWSCTNDVTVDEGSSITLGLGQSTTCTITNDDIAAEIVGTKFSDVNDNGVFDENESGIAGWHIALGRVNPPQEEGAPIPIEIVALSLTGVDGGFSLSAPASGQYKIFEERRDGWVTTNPEPAIDSFFDITYQVDLQPQQVPLVPDSFFDVFVEEAGQTIEVDNNKAPLLFGNHQQPVIHGEASTSVLETSAVITWLTDPVPGTSRVVYGTNSVSNASSTEAGTPNYGYASSTPESDTDPYVLSHSVSVSDLIPGTTYFYRVISRGSPEVTGGEQSFSTTIPTPPAETPPPAPSGGGGGGGGGSAPFTFYLESVTTADSSATVTWNTNYNSTSRVVYDTVAHDTSSVGPNYGYALSTATSDPSGVTHHSVTIQGLISAMSYYFRLVSSDIPDFSEHSFVTQPGAVITITTPETPPAGEESSLSETTPGGQTGSAPLTPTAEIVPLPVSGGTTPSGGGVVPSSPSGGGTATSTELVTEETEMIGEAGEGTPAELTAATEGGLPTRLLLAAGFGLFDLGLQNVYIKIGLWILLLLLLIYILYRIRRWYITRREREKNK